MDPNGDGDPSDGIDGWRLDVADMVNLNFWKTFHGWVKEINPDAYITGEIWWHDWQKNEMTNAQPWLQGDAFDGVMNYRFTKAIKKFMIDQTSAISAKAFADSMQAIYQDYPWERVLTCQNLMDSHDLDRLSSQLMNPDRWIDHDADPFNNPEYNTRKPDSIAWQKLRMIATVQFAMPGIPMIYYGTEAGMWGGDDPDDRKPMIWPEMNPTPETHNYLGQVRDTEDVVNFDHSLFQFYQKLASLRKLNPTLRYGKIKFQPTEHEHLLVFVRSGEQGNIWVVVNNSAKITNYSLPTSKGLKDLQSSKKLAKKELVIAPYEVKLLLEVQ